jgi:hypothetical protein
MLAPEGIVTVPVKVGLSIWAKLEDTHDSVAKLKDVTHDSVA